MSGQKWSASTTFEAHLYKSTVSLVDVEKTAIDILTACTFTIPTPASGLASAFKVYNGSGAANAHLDVMGFLIDGYR